MSSENYEDDLKALSASIEENDTDAPEDVVEDDDSDTDPYTYEKEPEDDESEDDDYDYDYEEDEGIEISLDDDDEYEDTTDYSSDFSDELTGFLNNTTEIDGLQVNLKDADKLMALVERGVQFTKSLDANNEEARAIASIRQLGLDLASEEMSLLLEAREGSAKAIAKLILDKNVPLDELDSYVHDYTQEGLKDYHPASHIVSKDSYVLNNLINEISNTPSGKRALEYVKNWDEVSKAQITKDPELLQLVQAMFDENIEQDINNKIKESTYFGRNTSTHDYLKFEKAFQSILQEQTKVQEKDLKRQAIRAGMPKPLKKSKYNAERGTIKLTEAEIRDLSDDEFMQIYNKHVKN